MKYIDDLGSLWAEKDSVITLGKFDGIHRGHRKLLDLVTRLAKERDLLPVVFTFKPSDHTIIPVSPSLMTSAEKKDMFASCGIALMAEIPLRQSLREMPPGDFVREILVKRLRAKAVVTGDDFRFGKDRAGDGEFLKKMQEDCGFSAFVEDKVRDEQSGREISSTLIREAVKSGKMEDARRFLGYAYTISGEIVHGRHLGHTIGFPTINIDPDPEKLLPPFGVYRSHVTVNGHSYDGISDLGVKPTVDGENTGLETHLFDCSGDLYGYRADVELHSFLRPEMKFASLDELKEQMKKDMECCRAGSQGE